MVEPRVHGLVARPLTPEGFAPFGTYATMPDRPPDWGASGSRIAGVEEKVAATGREVARLWRLGDLSFEGDVPYLGYVRYFHQGFRLAQLERHREETQSWIAVSGTGFVVVAPASGGDAPPIPESAEAFVVEPGDFIAIGRGVWMCHFFPLRSHADYLVVTARRSPEQDRDVVNFLDTAGTVLEITLG